MSTQTGSVSALSATMCPGPDCTRPVARYGNGPARLCEGHLKQRQRDPDKPLRPLRERYAELWQRVHKAILAVADAEEHEDWVRAIERFRRAVKDWYPSLPSRRQTNVVHPRAEHQQRGSTPS